MPAINFSNEMFLALARDYSVQTLVGEQTYHPETLIEPPFSFNFRFNHDHPLVLGAFSYSNSQFKNCSLEIGRYSSIAWGISWGGAEHPTSWLTTSSVTYDARQFWSFYKEDWRTRPTIDLPAREQKICIGNDVWIGQSAYLKSGVKIGDGAVVGAFSVVTKDVPPYAIVVGNPARIVRYRFSESLIERLKRVQWWRFSIVDLDGVDFTDPERALDTIETRISSGALKPYEPKFLRLGTIVEAIEKLYPQNRG